MLEIDKKVMLEIDNKVMLGIGNKVIFLYSRVGAGCESCCQIRKHDQW